ncbi:MAG: Mrp/NBP35 family ATP-binding protein [Sulfolobales archaeon]
MSSSESPYRMDVPKSGGVRVHTPQRRPTTAVSEKLAERMSKIRHKIVILSGKGGVGKSFVTSSLAMALALSGKKVGVADADFHGPSIPRMLGVIDEVLGAVINEKNEYVIIPAENSLGIKVVSIEFLLSDKTMPVAWRGAIKLKALQQFLEDVEWGSLDYLLIDSPPGTGDDALNIFQIAPVDYAIFVTIPSEVSSHIVAKSIRFVETLKRDLGKNVKILGVIENMSYFICDHGKTYYIFGSGGGEKLARALGVELLGKIPLDPRIAESNDAGEIFFVKYPDSPASIEFKNIAEKIIKMVEG